MENFLENGAVLPHGLLSHDDSAAMAGFNKTYKNTSLRMGIVIRSHFISDTANLSKLATEYDVLVFEQNEDKGSSIMTYKNCLSKEALGSIADFFEMTLRVRQVNTSPGGLINTKGQDGAVVLIECLDGMTEKAIIIGAMTHPDRKTTLLDGGPRLEGTFNGVNVKVEKDGSTSLIFNGATNSQGKAIDSSQGKTTLKIEKNGSFQVDQDHVTFRMDRSGDASLTAKKDINLTAQGNINIVVKGNANLTCTDINVSASGKASVKVGSNATVNVGGDCKLTAGGTVDVKASKINLNGTASGITTMNSHQGVIDFITGVPVEPSPTTNSDV